MRRMGRRGRRPEPPPFASSGGTVTCSSCSIASSSWTLAVARLVCIVLATALFVIVVAAVVARYGFGQAVSWTEEVPRYLLIWISFLGAAVGVLRREHVGFDVLFNALPERVRRVLGVVLEPADPRLRLDRVPLRHRLRAGFRRRPDGDDSVHELLVLPGDADLRRADDAVRAQARRSTRSCGRRPPRSPARRWIDAMTLTHPRPRLRRADGDRRADLVLGRRRLRGRRPSCCRASTTPRSSSAC